MTVKTKRILIPTLGLMGLGMVIGAGVYIGTKTKPERWQTNVDEARIAHYGLDGAQLISYIEDGSYKVVGQDEEMILDWKEKEISKTFWIYSYTSGEGIKFTISKGESLAYLLPGVSGDRYALGVESTRLNFNSKADREKFQIDPIANASLGHESVYKTGVILKLGQFKASYTVESVDATGEVQTPALSYDSDISSSEVKNLTQTWKDESGSDAITRNTSSMPVYKLDTAGNPIWFEDQQDFAKEVVKTNDNKWLQKRLEIPRGMESITTGLQLVGKDIKVTDKLGNIYDFGILERYGNEFAIHDKNKDADPDLKITAWW